MKNVECKNKKKSARFQIVSAIIWACAILGASYLTRGSEDGQTVTLWLIFLASFAVAVNGEESGDLRCLLNRIRNFGGSR